MAPGLEAWAKEELWGASLLPPVVRPGGQDQDQFGTFEREKLVGWPILPGLKTLRLSQASGIEVGSPSPPGWNQLRACPDSQGLKRAPGNPLDAKSKIIQRAFSPACSWFHHRPGVGSSLVSTGSSAAFEVSPSRKQSVTLKKGSDHFAFDLRRVYQKGRPHV